MFLIFNDFNISINTGDVDYIDTRASNTVKFVTYKREHLVSAEDFNRIKDRIDGLDSFIPVTNFGYVNADNIINFNYVEELMSYDINFESDINRITLTKDNVEGLDNSLFEALKTYRGNDGPHTPEELIDEIKKTAEGADRQSKANKTEIDETIKPAIEKNKTDINKKVDKEFFRKYQEDISNKLTAKADKTQITAVNKRIDGVEETLAKKADSERVDGIDERVTTNTQGIADANTRIDGLLGAVEIIGASEDKTKEQLLASNGEEAKKFVTTNAKRDPRKGDIVISSDGYKVYFNGTTWISAGISNVNIASTTSVGVVKLGTGYGQLELANADGTVRVKGYDSLSRRVTILERDKEDKVKVAEIERKVDENTSSITEVDTRVGDAVSSGVEGATITAQIATLDDKITNLGGNVADYETIKKLATEADQRSKTNEEVIKTKQDKLVAGKGINIAGSTISVKETDLTIDATKVKYNSATSQLGTENVQTAIDNTVVKINQNKAEIDRVKEDYRDNTVKTSGDQAINGNKTFSGDVFLMKEPTNEKHGTNKTYVDTELAKKANDDQVVKLSGTQSIAGKKTFTDLTVMKQIELGVGISNSAPVLIVPDTGKKPLTFNYGDKVFDIDLQQKTELKGLKEPTSDTHASTKKYVDDKFKQAPTTGDIDNKINEAKRELQDNIDKKQDIISDLNDIRTKANNANTVSGQNKTAIDQINNTLKTKANDSEVVKLTTDQNIDGNKTFVKPLTAHSLQLGHGVPARNEVMITPDEGNKNLTFTDGTNKSFNINLKYKTDLKGIKDPRDLGDAVNKKYVDQKVEGLATSENVDNKINAAKQEINNKIGTLEGTGLTGSTVTDLLKDAKTKIDAAKPADYDDTRAKAVAADTKSRQNETKITELEATVKGKADTSTVTDLTEKVNTNTQAIDAQKKQIEALRGSVDIIGKSDKTKDQLLASNGAEADKYVQATAKRPKEKGDIVISSDDSQLYYDGSKWNDFGTVNITPASTAKAGIIKLGTQEGQLEDKGGVAKVVGWDQTKLELANKVSNDTLNNYYNKSDIDGKVGDLGTTTLKGASVADQLKDAATKINAAKPSDYDQVKQKAEEAHTVAKKNESEITNIKSDVAKKIDTTTADGKYADKGDYEGFKSTTNDAISKAATKDELSAKADRQDLNAKANANEVVKLTGDQVVDGKKTFRQPTVTKHLELGLGVTTSRGEFATITPDEGTKQLTFNSGDKIFNIDLQYKTNLVGIKDPRNLGDAVNKKYVDNKVAELPTSENIDGKINEAKRELQGSIDAKQDVIADLNDIRTNATNANTTSTQNKSTIEQHTKSISELTEKIEAVRSSSSFAGVIDKTNTEVEADKDNLLNQFIQTKFSRAPKNGDTVNTNDHYTYIYSTENKWVPMGRDTIAIANENGAGVIKSTRDTAGYITVESDGKAKVNGWDSKANDNQVVKNTGHQAIEGSLLVTQNNATHRSLGAVNIDSKAGFISWSDNKSRIAYIGYASGADTNLKIENNKGGHIISNQRFKFTGGVRLITENDDLTTKEYVDTELAKIPGATDEKITELRNELTNQIQAKQDTISDLDTIRSNAQSAFDQITKDNQRLEKIESDVSKKVDTDTFNTYKGQVDTKFNSYTTTEAAQTESRRIEGLINAKANSSDVYTKGQVDGIKSELNSAIGTKANDNAVAKLTGDQEIDGSKTFIKPLTANSLKLGHGVSASTGQVSVLPDDGNKVINFGTTDSNKFDIDLNGKTALKNLKTPVEDNEATTKKYVDDLVAKTVTGGAVESVSELVDQKIESKLKVLKNASEVISAPDGSIVIVFS